MYRNAARGEAAGSSKLTKEKVLKIRKLYASGKYTYQKIGDMYLVCHQTIARVVNRESWRHV